MEHILVVEDEASIRKALLMGLASKSFEVDMAPDGNGGILLGSQKEYDILIADLCLPDMDGLKVIKTIKNFSPEIISIIITGNSSLDSSLEAIRLEVSDYIEKPLGMEAIKNSIERGLEKRNLKRIKLGQMLELYKEQLPDSKEIKSKTQNDASCQFSKTISMIVHQISNPLMVIFGNAELGMDQLDDMDASKQCFTSIIKASEDINAINREIINIHKPVKENIQRIDIGILLDNCLQRFKGLMTLKGISIEHNLNGDHLTVLGNSFDFEQLLKNIVMNAIDSMDGISTKLLKIWTEVDADESTGFVYIEDTGCGISEESMDNIFEPYFTSSGHGTGLGLSVAKDIIEKNGGNIAVYSQPGKGTTFKISFPIKARPGAT